MSRSVTPGQLRVRFAPILSHSSDNQGSKAHLIDDRKLSDASDIRPPSIYDTWEEVEQQGSVRPVEAPALKAPHIDKMANEHVRNNKYSWKYWAETTTCNGFVSANMCFLCLFNLQAHLMLSRNGRLWIFWLVVIILIIILMLVSLIEMIISYHEGPLFQTSVSSRRNTEMYLEFPSMLICSTHLFVFKLN
jgi:hypothetical protein